MIFGGMFDLKNLKKCGSALLCCASLFLLGFSKSRVLCEETIQKVGFVIHFCALKLPDKIPEDIPAIYAKNLLVSLQLYLCDFLETYSEKMCYCLDFFEKILKNFSRLKVEIPQQKEDMKIYTEIIEVLCKDYIYDWYELGFVDVDEKRYKDKVLELEDLVNNMSKNEYSERIKTNEYLCELFSYSSEESDEESEKSYFLYKMYKNCFVLFFLLTLTAKFFCYKLL